MMNLSVKKGFYADLKTQTINQWIKRFDSKNSVVIGLMVSAAPDFQHNQQLALLSKQQERYCFNITKECLIPFSIYFATRHCIKHTWINHNDQFLYPNDKWQENTEFQNDCLSFVLLHEKNKISSIEQDDENKKYPNHFIPFTETEVGARTRFESHFMTDFINGKIKAPKQEQNAVLIEVEKKNFIPTSKLEFSKEAKAVFDAGREIWRYYHSKCDDKSYNVNASFYDIKAHFKGRKEMPNGKSRVNQKSKDEHFNALTANLREKLNLLAAKITPKIYEYGFLRE